MMDENNPQINPVDSCINILNVLLASLTIFERNVKIAHWNYQSSIDFIQTHVWLDTVHDDICESIDAVAEEIRKADRFPDADLATCLGKSLVAPVTGAEPFNKAKTFSMLQVGLFNIRKIADDLSTMADENKFWTIQDLANDILKKTNHHLYFVKNTVVEPNISRAD